jgi:hypothetical protein
MMQAMTKQMSKPYARCRGAGWAAKEVGKALIGF